MSEEEILQINGDYKKNGQKISVLVLDKAAKIEITKLRNINNNQNEAITSAARNLGALLARNFIIENDVTSDINIQTPITITDGIMLHSEKILLIPILRAGLEFAKGMFEVLKPAAKGIIHIANDHKGNEKKGAQVLKIRFPEISDKAVINVVLIEGVIASGATIRVAIEQLLKEGYKKIHVVAVISVRETLEKLATEFPTVKFTVACLDKGLTKQGYLTPGLGDAGDRLYGEKNPISNTQFNKKVENWLSKESFDQELKTSINGFPDVSWPPAKYSARNHIV